MYRSRRYPIFETDLLLAAQDLEVENNPKRLPQYLSIFRSVPYPLSPDRLFILSGHEDDWISRLAINALTNVSHSSVRSFALEMNMNAHRPGEMVRLLSHNYQDGAWQLIDRLAHLDLDRDDYHALGYSIRDVYEIHPNPDAAAVFLTLYDRGPCANCRYHFLEHLQAIQSLPIWVIEECRHDSSSRIRETFGQKPRN